MENKIVQFQSVVEKVESLKDGSIKLKITTQELPADQMAVIFKFMNLPIWSAFKEIPLETSDIKEEPAEFTGQKSLSQRLYNTLFVLHGKKGRKPEEFEDYRKKYMERLIQGLKDQISELEN